MQQRIFDWIFTGYRVLWLPVIFLVIGLFLNAWYQYGTLETRTETIEHKERICDGSGENSNCFWMVFTDQGEYRNSDAILHLKWSSTTLQRELKLGETVTFTTYGWRVPFLSLYPNIIEVK